MVQLKFKKLTPSAIIPKYSRQGDAAFDVYSDEDHIIPANGRYGFSTGIASEFPEGHVLLLRGRSGLAFKNGINPLGGVIDASYRGEIKVMLHNTSNEPVEIKKGDRIVQGIIFELPQVEIVEAIELSENAIRGEKGFGSSGR